MLPPWLLLTVVGVSMVSSSGVFWTRAFIGEIKFLWKRALIVKVSVMLGSLAGESRLSLGLFSSVPIAVCACGIFQHPV